MFYWRCSGAFDLPFSAPIYIYIYIYRHELFWMQRAVPMRLSSRFSSLFNNEQNQLHWLKCLSFFKAWILDWDELYVEVGIRVSLRFHEYIQLRIWFRSWDPKIYGKSLDFRTKVKSKKVHPTLVITKNLQILNNLNQLNPQCWVRKIIYHTL